MRTVYSGPLTDAQRDLANQHYGLVWWFARPRLRKHPYWADDIRSAAHLGLVLAARSFDPTRHCQFATHAVKYMQGEYRNFLQAQHRRSARGPQYRADWYMALWAAEPRHPEEAPSRAWEQVRHCLTAKQQHVFLLHFGLELSESEVAAQLGSVQPNVNACIQRGLAAIRRQLFYKG